MKKKLAPKAAAVPKAATPAPKEKAKEREIVKPLEDTEEYRVKLEEMRENLIRTVKKKKEEAIPEAEVGDEGDVAMRSLARDLIFGQTDNEHRLLDDVEAALRRIEKNVYGVCEGNGERIPLARLKAIPYARYCINCQARFESI